MKTKTGAIVQARMSSSRFPGKVLHIVSGKPMLLYLLERLKRCTSLDMIVVATSSDNTDTVIAELCGQLDLPCFRGSLTDVAGRFKDATAEYQLDAFVRVNGDSPLLDQNLIDKAVNIFLDSDCDLVTNLMPATYPKGQSIEVLRSKTYRQAYDSFKEDDEREHVTPYFYKHTEDFRIYNFSYKQNINDIKLCVDTPADMDMFAAIISNMDKPHTEYSLEDILRIYHELSHSIK